MKTMCITSASYGFIEKFRECIARAFSLRLDRAVRHLAAATKVEEEFGRKFNAACYAPDEFHKKVKGRKSFHPERAGGGKDILDLLACK